ncbi:MAG: LbetaH domain-containing protein [Eubacteriales bacterium]
MIKAPKTQELFDLSQTCAVGLLENALYPWEVIGSIAGYIHMLGENLSPEKYDKVGDGIWIAKNASIAPSASISGPCIIDSGAEIRHCAYIRGSVIIGANSVIGNSCEIKNSILFNSVQTPHFNYVGDSLLGYGSHMGAGAIISNVKSDKSEISICTAEGKIQAGMRKLGAILGDYVEVGCNSVLFPGSIIGKGSMIYPLSKVRGVVPEYSIYKDADHIISRDM